MFYQNKATKIKEEKNKTEESTTCKTKLKKTKVKKSKTINNTFFCVINIIQQIQMKWVKIMNHKTNLKDTKCFHTIEEYEYYLLNNHCFFLMLIFKSYHVQSYIIFIKFVYIFIIHVKMRDFSLFFLYFCGFGMCITLFMFCFFVCKNFRATLT